MEQKRQNPVADLLLIYFAHFAPIAGGLILETTSEPTEERMKACQSCFS
jgi:hypothetical protein